MHVLQLISIWDDFKGWFGGRDSCNGSLVVDRCVVRLLDFMLCKSSKEFSVDIKLLLIILDVKCLSETPPRSLCYTILIN